MALPNFINTIAPEPSLARWTSLINSQPVPFPVVFYGDTKDMLWYFHNNGSIESFSGNAAYSLRVTLGNVDAGPTGGNYTLTCGETTAALVWNADATAIAGALNSLATVIAFGGVNVSGVFPNFQIYSNNIGVVTAISADDALISPDSTISANILTTGSVTARQQTLLTLRRGLITQQTNWTPTTNPAGWSGALEMSGEAAASLLAEFGEMVGGYLQVQTQITAEVIKNADSTVTAYYQTTVLFRGKNSDFTGVITPPSPPYAIGDILYGNAQGGLSKLPGNTSLTLKVLSQTGDGAASAVPAWIDPDTQGVTSVGLSLPSDLFTVTNSPVTGAGTLTGTLKTQVANTIWAGPTTGVDASPAFRTLVSADLPALTTGAFVLTGNGSGGFTNTDLTYSTPTLTTPDGFNISSAGSIALTAGGTAKSISILPSTTGGVGIGVAGSTGQRIKEYGASVTTTPVEATWWTSAAAGLYGGFSEGSTAGVSDWVFGHSSDSAQGTVIFPKKSRGTLAAPTIVANGDSSLLILGGFFDGTGFRNTAGIAFTTDGTIVAGTNVPTSITFATGEGLSRATGMTLKPSGSLRLGVSNRNSPAWATDGIFLATTTGRTITDSNSGTGTVASAVFNSFAVPTINALSASVVYTNLANVYIAGDVATAGNASATNSYGLWNVGKTRLDGLVNNPGGIKRVSTQFDSTGTTLGNVTGLSVSLPAATSYRFRAVLFTTANVAGGVKAAVASSGSVTNIIYEGLTYSAGTVTQSRSTASGTPVGAVTAVTAATIVIEGTITTNAAGNLTVQFANNVATGTSSVLVGSYMEVFGF